MPSVPNLIPILLVGDAILVFVVSEALLAVMNAPREVVRLGNIGFLIRLVFMIVLILVLWVVGFLTVGPVMLLGEVALALLIGILMFRYWPSFNRAITTGPTSDAIWGGVILILGLGTLVSSLRRPDWHGVIAGFIVGGAGAALMVQGIRKMSSGE